MGQELDLDLDLDLDLELVLELVLELELELELQLQLELELELELGHVFWSSLLQYRWLFFKDFVWLVVPKSGTTLLSNFFVWKSFGRFLLW